MCEVLNKRVTGVPAGAIYIGRGSKWGNPFRVGPDSDRPPSSQSTNAGSQISIICCARSTSCAVATSSASAHRSPATATSCVDWPTPAATSGSRGGAL